MLWRWKFVAGNGETIAVSSESYYNKSDCIAGITLIKIAGDALVIEE